VRTAARDDQNGGKLTKRRNWRTRNEVWFGSDGFIGAGLEPNLTKMRAFYRQSIIEQGDGLTVDIQDMPIPFFFSWLFCLLLSKFRII
jgi:hypothetical protein